MSVIRKYAGLPDLDLAPDIYETPELTDDTSTLPTSTTLRSESPTASDSALGDNENGIDRHRLNQNEARTHFFSSRERPGNQSGKLSDKRKSHKSFNQRRRKDGEDIINDIDVSGSEDEESLNRRLARLRREVAEVKNQLQKQREESEHPEGAASTADEVEVESISTILDAVKSPVNDRDQPSASRFVKRLNPQATGLASNESITKPVDYQNGGVDQSKRLETDDASLIADFDARLESLEEALGIQSLPLGTQEKATDKTLLPTLDMLDKQLLVLSTASDASIDKVKGRVKELAREAELLEHNRVHARRALEALSPSDARYKSSTSKAETTDGETTEDSEQVTKINALYGTIETIESLAPMLPSVLDRLRSLRDLHANAAGASESLDAIEKRQEDMKDELRSWKEGLEKVERAVGQNQETSKENTELIEGWMKELEQRMSRVG